MNPITLEICKHLDTVAAKYDLDGDSMLDVLGKVVDHYKNPVTYNYLNMNADYSRQIHAQSTKVTPIPLIDLDDERATSSTSPVASIFDENKKKACPCVPFDPTMPCFNKQLESDEYYALAELEELSLGDRVLCFMNIKSGRIVEGIITSFTKDMRPHVKRLMANGRYTDEKRPVGCQYNRHKVIYKATKRIGENLDEGGYSKWENYEETDDDLMVIPKQDHGEYDFELQGGKVSMADSPNSTGDGKAKRQQRTYSVDFKLEVVDYVKENPIKNEAARKFGVASKRIREWIAQEADLRSAQLKRARQIEELERGNVEIVEGPPIKLPVFLNSDDGFDDLKLETLD
ncbi:unnamed protein product, partial [Mesorhabditis belari]|uniref:Brinker DNA-binding domain-containing protein n=1 Tax=Mesorhabditis belari TaxID=2138241 RepID=A0AAF3FTF8_9BILA